MEAALIERFFNKQCTPLEAKQVAMYLKANPSVLEKYLSKDEWNDAALHEELPPELWDELWQNINQKNKAKVISTRLKRFVAAASIVFIIAAIYFLHTPSKPVVAKAANTIAAPLFKTQTTINTTKQIMQVVLQDSSVVMLSPSSSIKYDVPFQNNKRQIWLSGEAVFHVAKNKAKPFTVYAGALATTALGTVFSVKQVNDKSNIVVKLFKGRIVIQSVYKNLQGWDNDVYLSPGEQLKFDVTTSQLTVKRNISNQNTTAQIKANNNAVADSLKNELLFSNDKLPVVLNKLAAFYNVPIQYDSLMIDTMRFTGTVSKHDSIPIILKAISEMNNLEVIQNDKGYTIQKPTSN